ncbi:unnamed protein product [Mytilus edulis]|uniref:Uncharacterized protein n=1 Tax=Mytilus edulis TaxID=6550 RepID=A0A8S3SW76_MYTED|nr:unnamed protein product [Mytilus edulis]
MMTHITRMWHDHPNYTRWIPIHVRDKFAFDTIAPSIATEFESGNFVVHKTLSTFSAIAIDQAHEQNNKLVKGEGGVIGLTENASQLLRWIVCGPEMARAVNEFELSQELIKHEQSKGPDIRHNEHVDSKQKAYVKQVIALTATIEEMGNPFLEESEDLLLLTHVIYRIDVIWDEYRQDSLKASTCGKRGKGIRRRVQAYSTIPGHNRESFLRIDDNKTDLFDYLAEQLLTLTLSVKTTVVSTKVSEVVCNKPDKNNGNLSPCNYKEADSRIFLHVADAVRSGMQKIMIRTVDPDVVVIVVSAVHKLNITSLWMALGVGKLQVYPCT